MTEYVYVLSHPRMHGLIKVGKTTKAIDQRMKELHSTGVPEPFELECAFVVDDCNRRERAAHTALAKYRVKRREFFEIGVEAALKKMLPVLGNYTVYRAKSDFAIEELAEKLKRQTDERNAKAEKQREERLRLVSELKQQQQRQAEIEQRLLMEEGDVHAWYREELARRFPKHSLLLFSVPIAAVSFVLLPELMPKLTDAGMLAVSALTGWAGGSLLRNWNDEWRKKSGERSALESELRTRLAAVREIVRECPSCGQKLKFQRAHLMDDTTRLDWNCPRCHSPILK